MKIGIGLPAVIPGVKGPQILEWARQAEAASFSSLGIIDRIVYANYEPLVTLAAAAAVTERVRLVTTVLIAPLRSAGLLAKQSASIDALSNGRLTLGLGIGAREDDYHAVSSVMRNRGKRLEEQLDTMTRIWSGQAMDSETGPIGPRPVQPGGPEVLLGGYSVAAARRVARWGHGFMAGGGSPQLANQFFREAENAWQQAGRAGKPRLVGCAYFALGPNAAERGGAYILDYYAFLGEAARLRAQAIPGTPEAIRQLARAFEDIGADELILWPTLPDLDQVQRLAEVVAGL